MLMVKPGMPYLDMLREVKNKVSAALHSKENPFIQIQVSVMQEAIFLYMPLILASFVFCSIPIIH